MDKDHFRNWLRNIWLDNCAEHDAWGEPQISIKQYFNKYKWWLRREYRFQQNETTSKR